MQNWFLFKRLYEQSKDNHEYLKYLKTCDFKDNTIINKDNTIDINPNLISDFTNNKLITLRLGVVETRFLIQSKFNYIIPLDDKAFNQNNYDKELKDKAGLYYTNPADKNMVNNWWLDNVIELITSKNTTIMSCYRNIAYDLLLLSLLDIKNKIIASWTTQGNLIDLFAQRKILVLSNGANEMRRSYEIGLQRIYNINIRAKDLDMTFIETPQTTTGMSMPHGNMIETTESIINLIDSKYSNFDTILFACGAYAPVLINLLSKKYNNINLLHLGSYLYSMFGLYSHSIKIPVGKKIFNVKNFSEILTPCPKECLNIENGRYWKISS